VSGIRVRHWQGLWIPALPCSGSPGAWRHACATARGNDIAAKAEQLRKVHDEFLGTRWM
jgi:hypothetical protein